MSCIVFSVQKNINLYCMREKEMRYKTRPEENIKVNV